MEGKFRAGAYSHFKVETEKTIENTAGTTDFSL